MVPSVVRSKRDKSEHPWGARRWWCGADRIHQLAEPEESIVDPFAGTATWGRIACEMERRWIGADIKPGSAEAIVAD
jgi:hypothetical protein